MVTLDEATASNQRIASTLPSGLVAIFVGGTSGVGEYMLKAFARYSIDPRVYIIGRSQEAAERIIKECQELNGYGGSFEFIGADVSLLKNIDDVCRHIKRKETVVNILFQSQGTMAFSSMTAEGLPLGSSIVMHGRTRFILNLLPLLQQAPSLRRVVSVLAASYEGAIDLDNIHGLGFSLQKGRNQSSAIQTLLLEEAARRAPDVSFVHTVPGVVKSGILRDADKSFTMTAIITIAKMMGPLIETPPDVCGELHLFYATSERYASQGGGAIVAGVRMEGSVTAANGSHGRVGSGVCTLNTKGESSSPKVEKLLEQYRRDGTAKKVWEHVKADFVKVTGMEVVA